ncbi:MAG: terminase gpA endonuclease subunit, partial [Planctomycetota bacterium]
RVMGKIEQAVLEGGLFALAMPRGSGKTSLAECACLWAILYGHRDFVCLIGSDEAHAADMLDSLKTELETNDRLLEDFPEAVFPIQALDGIPHRAGGQLYHGERTHIGWTAKEIVMPTIPDSPASGAIIKVAGITGRIRGMKFKRPDGQAVRPSLVVLDDPQTDESARSVSQCQHREATLAGAVLGLAGPGRKIAGVMPCTVIRPGDMADRILDRELHPEWNGERTKMLYASPKATRLWERYAELRAESLRAGRGLELATQFYRDHRADMDAGARIAWPDRHNPDELSAIQHAMNLQLQDERAFWAEYQNEPLPDALAETDDLNVDVLLGRLNGYERRQIPTAAEHLTAFVDVQQKALFYVVCAWAADFSGWIIDYGTWPDQKRDYFTLRDLRSTLAMVAKGAGLEGSIYHGLEKLSADLMDRRWRRDDGAELSIDRLLIDANWGQSTDVVYQFCRASNYRANLLPSHGRYVGASSLPMSEQRRKRGDRVGLNWRLPGLTGRRAIRHVVFDANYWKSFIHARLCVAMGDPGGLSLWGRAGERHRRFAEHCCAEYRVRTAGRGREVDEWKLRPEGDDNHWFDGVVGCAVAASILGAAIPEVDGNGPAKDRKRIRLSSYKSSR